TKPGKLRITASANGMEMAEGNSPKNREITVSGKPESIKITMADSIVKTRCVSLNLSYLDASGTVSQLVETDPPMTLSSTAGGEFFFDNLCEKKIDSTLKPDKFFSGVARIFYKA